MAEPTFIPRINNNDDEVRLTSLLVRQGEFVSEGRPVAEIATDKANVIVEAAAAGYIVRIEGTPETMVRVGSVLLWSGTTADEPVPSDEPRAKALPAPDGVPPVEATAKARMLLAQHGLSAAQVPARGQRLTADDVEVYVRGRVGENLANPPPEANRGADLPAASGRPTALSVEERGMLRSVLWHRDEAVPAYVEVDLDPLPWKDYARSYAERHRLLGDPLLPLMAHRLVSLAHAHPRVNSTIVDGRRYAYEHVNLGFTIQVDQRLYLVVVPDAEILEASPFLAALTRLHKAAVTNRLRPEDLRGATVGFSSMARWSVSRHVPILPPHVSLIVAHAGSSGSRVVLGATYDHRVLTGGDVADLLGRLSHPPSCKESHAHLD